MPESAAEDRPKSAELGLRERDRGILAFEAAWGAHGGAKEEAIRTELDLTPARYYQLLGRLIDTEAALASDPLLVGRLRRARDQQRRSRMPLTGSAAS